MSRGGLRVTQAIYQAATINGAVNTSRKWEDYEIRILLQSGMSNLEKAQRLGRTYSAITSKRRDLKVHPYRIA